ncbi:MAG: L-carnitine dehydrogenase [Ardenticatenaceae bacterium]
MDEIKTVGIVGSGLIGSGWAARFLAHGLDVIATDPAPGAEEGLRVAVDNAWPALQKLGLMPGADRGRLRFTNELEELCKAADFIQECAPEREELKRNLHRQMDGFAAPEVIIASSSSGLLPTGIQADCQHPGRIVIGHPFNPVYLLPLVEVLGGEKTHASSIQKAMAFYKWVGMYPLHVRKEIEGYISDRLQEALWREALHLVNDGIATTKEIDDAIIYGPGLRLAMMGTFLTFHLAGGDDGMRHMLEQFGPALKLPWTKLKAPELTDELIDRVVEGTAEQSAGQSVKELEQLRDNCLIGIMQTLRQHDYASGKLITDLDAKRYTSYEHTRWTPDSKIERPLKLYNCAADPTWIDYNGHMTEASYLTAFGDASDALFRYIGIDEAYRAAGHSFYTVETHINYYREVGSGEPLSFTTQLIGLDHKRLHFFHAMYHGITNTLLATTEQMLVHVDSNASASAPIKPHVYQALTAIMHAHKDMPKPKQVGRQMAVRKKK